MVFIQPNTFLSIVITITFLHPTQVIINSTAAYLTQERTSWVRGWPGQAVLAVTQFYWTNGVQEAIKSGGNVNVFLCSWNYRLLLLLMNVLGKASLVSLYSLSVRGGVLGPVLSGVGSALPSVHCPLLEGSALHKGVGCRGHGASRYTRTRMLSMLNLRNFSIFKKETSVILLFSIISCRNWTTSFSWTTVRSTRLSRWSVESYPSRTEQRWEHLWSLTFMPGTCWLNSTSTVNFYVPYP